MGKLKKEFELYLLSDDCGWCDGKEWMMGTHEINNLWHWIEQKIDEACKKQTCENCKHWHNSDVDIDHEVCNKEKSFVCGLPTYSNFGCVEFEPSPKESV